MQKYEFDTRSKTKPSLSRQVVERQRDEHEAQDTRLPQRGPFEPVISGIGDASSSGVHASMLNRATNGRPSRAGQSLLRLQRQYGNRYVQRVLALARKGAGETEAALDVEQVIQRARGSGQVLDSKVRTQMESAFGADFGDVRVHTDTQADTLNRELNARAFTTGQDIFFRNGAHSPGTSRGRELLAHELTHVVQQNGDKVQRKLTLGQPGDKYEQEADQVARAVMQQEQQVVQRDSDEGLVRRQIEEEEEEEEPVQTKVEDASIQRQMEKEEEEEEVIQPKPEDSSLQRQVEEEEEPIQIKVEERLTQRLMRGDKQRFESVGILKAEEEKTPPEEGKATMEPPWSKDLCKKWKEEELKSGLPGFTKKYVEAKYSHCEDVVNRWDTHYGKWEGTLDKDQQWFFWEYGKSFARPEVKRQEYWKKNLLQRFYMSRRYAPSVREKAKQVL